MNLRNIDDLLSGIQSETEEDIKPKAVPEIHDDPEEEKEEPEKRSSEPEHKEEAEKDDGESDDQPSDREIDDYGNEIPQARTYTEEEVNNMMRERFSRSSMANLTQQQQAQVQNAAQGFQPDPNSEETWEQQLKSFVKETFNEMHKENETREWQEREANKQAEFEGKFTTGMNRYKDFHAVVTKVPLTDTMMFAIRDMKDPAAFVYAAAKTQSGELNRIKALTDPFAQAVQLGQLEEKMKKAKNLTKSAPPLSSTKGDVSTKEKPKYSIDDRINQHAKGKFRR